MEATIHETNEPGGELEIEDRQRQVVEVITLWGSTVTSAEHLAEPRDYTIGEGPGADLFAPGVPTMPLVRRTESGDVVVLPPGASGDLTAGTTRWTFAELIAQGRAVASDAVLGATELRLAAGAQLKIDVGALTLLVRRVSAGKPPRAASWTIDWRANRAAGVSVALHAAFLFLVWAVPPSPRSLSGDLLTPNPILARYVAEAAELVVEPVPEAPTTRVAAGGRGGQHGGAEGRMGKKNAPRSDGHFALQGAQDNVDPHVARARALESARTSGILGILSAQGGFLASAFSSRPDASGNDAQNVLGALTGNRFAENYGDPEAFGMRGPGHGGGCRTGACLGIGFGGPLSTIGRGIGNRDGRGLVGPGTGGLPGRPPGTPPPPRPVVTTSGQYPREAIRRVVRQRLAEVRYCYEQRLRVRPDLAGRVPVTFIIATDGAVQSAVIGGSTLGDVEAEQCIALAVRRWGFPPPSDGGVVTVTYPFVLERAEGARE